MVCKYEQLSLCCYLLRSCVKLNMRKHNNLPSFPASFDDFKCSLHDQEDDNELKAATNSSFLLTMLECVLQLCITRMILKTGG